MLFVAIQSILRNLASCPAGSLLLASLWFAAPAFAQGKFISFDAPGSVHGTDPTSINGFGVIAGFYWDAHYLPHGFVRTALGAITSFDPSSLGYGTFPSGINAAGIIAGSYYDANFVFHGFTRTSRGALTSFDPPGSVGTYALGINAAGAITGYLFRRNH
ncbi:MAG: hypothetical protein HY294_05215 [Candidatus Rokubacteria bacterium]|nr:hypothetical protein [Candidatus Rokubacteria bacterium]MBI3825377.1 hypothetical protein [Candidatus Rokubacteria bacterium]